MPSAAASPSPSTGPCAARNSSTRRDLPAPAEPRTVKSWQARSLAARAKALSRSAASRRRPTIGASSRRVRIGEREATATTRYAGIGSALPRSDSGSTGSATTASRTRRQVGSPISTVPGSAAAWSRAAVFMASPMRGVPSPGTRTSPVVTPTLAVNGKGEPAASSARRTWISIAARTARRASSSWATGSPKTAETASPMYFSTLPPWRSIAPRAAAK